MPVSAPSPALVNRVSPAPPAESLRSVVVIATPKPLPAINPKLARIAVVLVVVLGGTLRLAAWLGDRNLWIDESMLAWNLVSRAPAQLLEPLDWNQGSPVGFLFASKASILSFGESERALRLVPFLGSVLGLLGFTWLAPRVLPPVAAMFAIALFSLSPGLLSYSAECKQYATDAAIAIGLHVVALRLLEGALGVRRWAVLALSGAAAVWCSHPSVFVLGGIGTVLALSAIRAHDRLRLLAALATIVTWLISFGLCYALILRHLDSNAYLREYWTGHFLPRPHSMADLVWFFDHFFAPFEVPGGLGGTEIRAGGIAAGLFLLGLWKWTGRWNTALALVLPAGMALFASALHKYPFAGRLLLFLVPALILITAQGAAILVAAVRRTQPAAAAILLAILFAAPLLESVQELRRPARSEQLQPVLNEMRGCMRPTDRAYVYYGALPAFDFYTQHAPLPVERIDRGVEARSQPVEYRRQLSALRGEPRVWLIFSHGHKQEEAIITAYAECLGRRIATIPGTGAHAVLFDFSAPPTAEANGATSVRR